MGYGVPAKKSSEKKHLKKRKTKVQLTERYNADDIYDPDSDHERSTMKKYKIGKKFNSINPPEKKTKKLPFPVPGGKSLGPVKIRKQNQFLQNLNKSELTKNMPAEMRRKAT